MKTTIFNSMFFLVSFITASVWASDAPPAPLVAEVWTCSYNDGKDVDDLFKARDFLVSQADKTGLKLPPSFLWSVMKGDAPIDYVWFNVHPNIETFGDSYDALLASGISAAVSKRFSSVADCVAGLATAQMIFAQGNPAASVPDGPAFLAAHSCRYNDGASRKSLADLIGHMNAFMTSLGDSAPAFSTVMEPYTRSAANTPEVTLYSGYAKAAGWSKYVKALTNTKSGQDLQNHTNEILDCDLTIWSSQRMIAAM